MWRKGVIVVGVFVSSRMKRTRTPDGETSAERMHRLWARLPGPVGAPPPPILNSSRPRTTTRKTAAAAAAAAVVPVPAPLPPLPPPTLPTPPRAWLAPRAPSRPQPVTTGTAARSAFSEASLTPEQRHVLDLVRAKENVFVTGAGGCGKTYLVQVLTAVLGSTGTPFALTTSTGTAAELYRDTARATTLHSFLCLRDGRSPEECAMWARRTRQRQLTALEVLIVDEVSMVSAETMRQAMDVLRLCRGASSGLPTFVLVGDFLQLPNVSGTSLLDSPLWHALRLHAVLLSAKMRHADDPAFAKILDEARHGCLSAPSVAALRERVDAPLPDLPPDMSPTDLLSRNDAVNAINQRSIRALPGVHHTFVAFLFAGFKGTDDDHGEDGVQDDEDDTCVEDNPEDAKPAEIDDNSDGGVGHDTPARCPVRRHIQDFVRDKTGRVQTVIPGGEGGRGGRGGAQHPSHWQVSAVKTVGKPPAGVAYRPAAGRDKDDKDGMDVALPPAKTTWQDALQLAGSSRAPPALELAIGAQVMFVANVSVPTVVNGSQGVVTSFQRTTGLPIVRLAGSGKYIVVKPYAVSTPIRTGARQHLVYMQLPLQLAWAITMHKAQGKTLEFARLDLGPSVFQAAQAYVALSRVRSLRALTLTDFDPSVVHAPKGPVEYYQALEREKTTSAEDR